MPKNKTHSGAKKRIKVTGSGKLLHAHSGMRHHQERKPSRLTRRLTGMTDIAPSDTGRMKKLLGL
jgi:large subunit ribosomal protein L35